MSEKEKELFCPSCKTWYPTIKFECLPLDLRCNKCIPADAAMVLYDKRVQKAAHEFATIVDASGKATDLGPLERMVQQSYDSWGGPAAFCEDIVTWIKDLAATGRGKGAAVSAAMKLLALHAKVDKMRLDDEWKTMDDQTLRQTLKVKMLELFAEAQADNGKEKFVTGVTGGND